MNVNSGKTLYGSWFTLTQINIILLMPLSHVVYQSVA